MEIVDKQYVDNTEVVGVTTPANVSQTNLKVTDDNRLATLSKRGGVIKIGLDSWGNYYVNKKIELPDNQGKIKLVLIADCTQWYNSGEDNTKRVDLTGFTGRIHCIRNSGYNIALEGPVNAFVQYISNYSNSENVIRLESSIDICRPVIVKYQDKYYVALSLQGAGYVVKLEGFLNNNLDELIILNGTLSTHLCHIDGVEYVLTDYSKTYYRHYVEKSQTAELANSVKDGCINIMKLNAQARRPYIHISTDGLNTIDHDSIVNTVWNTYGANANQAMPTLAVVYTTNNSTDSVQYNRQLMYNPNLGTFQYRNKVTTSNNWDNWTPIPIPQTSIQHKSYLKSEHIDAITVSGFYVLTNNSNINYSTLAEFIVVHNSNQGQVFQTHYGGNGNIKGRVGNLQSNGTVNWNNWSVKNKTYHISTDGNMYLYSNLTNAWNAMTVSDLNEIINNLHLPYIKCKGRVKNSTDNYTTCDVKLYKKNSLLMSYFDFDTNQTVYIKVYVEGEAIKTTTKRINHTV